MKPFLKSVAVGAQSLLLDCAVGMYTLVLCGVFGCGGQQTPVDMRSAQEIADSVRITLTPDSTAQPMILPAPAAHLAVQFLVEGGPAVVDVSVTNVQERPCAGCAEGWSDSSVRLNEDTQPGSSKISTIGNRLYAYAARPLRFEASFCARVFGAEGSCVLRRYCVGD